MARDLPQFRLYRLDDEDREEPVTDEMLERAVLDHNALARSLELADLLRSAPSSLGWRVEDLRRLEGPSEILLRWLERSDVVVPPDWPVARLRMGGLGIQVCHSRISATEFDRFTQLERLADELVSHYGDEVGFVLSPVTEPLRRPYAPYSPASRVWLDTSLGISPVDDARQLGGEAFVAYLDTVGIRGVLSAYAFAVSQRGVKPLEHPLSLVGRIVEGTVFDELAALLARQSLAFARWRRLASRVPLTQDVTISFRHGGCDAWLLQDLVLDGFELGAPPDPLARGGQRWGLCVANPLANAITQDLDLSTALPLYRAIGAQIRLDHVLGLRRRFAYHLGEVSGAYVEVADDRELENVARMTRALRLEVVGEDLGRVPEDFRALLLRHRIPGLDVPYFMGHVVGSGTKAHSRVLATSTFDLPTLTGMLSGADSQELERLGRAEEAEYEITMTRALEHALGCVPGSLVSVASPRQGVQYALAQALKRAEEASVRATWVMLEDLLGIESRANIPGSSALERENWLGEIDLDPVEVLTNLRSLMIEV